MLNSTITESIQIKNIEAYVFRAPIINPVRTSFGTMHDRPALFVRITDSDGMHGWGEIWCNFPSVGAEHRAKLLMDVFKPNLVDQRFYSPMEAFKLLTHKTAVLAIQSGEYGPIHQITAGIDIALWDLFAKRANKPLWSYLGGKNSTIATYASGINPEFPEKTIEACLSNQFTAFKLKVGFDAKKDLVNLINIRSLIPDHALMVDANQAWDPEGAVEQIKSMEQFNLSWIEEPIRADSAIEDWQYVAKNSQAALAVGENLAGISNFNEAISSGIFQVIQPDIAKWGGISECLAVGKKIVENKICYCPHFLGGGIGLLASGHLLAAVGGDGMLEIDINMNPLRSLCCGPLEKIANGEAKLSDEPGLGVNIDLNALEKYRIIY